MSHTLTAYSPSRGALRSYRVLQPRMEHARPSLIVLFGILAAFVLPVSMIPSTWGGLFHFPLLPNVWWTTNLMVVFAVVIVFYRLLGNSAVAVEKATAFWILAPALLLGLWQTVSLAWNGRANYMREYSFLQSLTMCCAATASVVLVSGLPRSRGLLFARAVTLLVMFVTGVYACLSFVVPGWRPSDQWMDRTNEGLGFIRLFGPLGTATTMNFVLLPALGVAVGFSFVRGVARFFWASASLFFCFAILSTGSRGAVLSLLAYGLAMLASLRLRALLFLLPMMGVMALLLAVTGIPERFRNLEDKARFETYATAVRAYTESATAMTVGVGHGGLYSKLHDDSVRSTYGKSRWFLLEDRTPYGYTLRNSHSVFMRALSETGPVGLLLVVTPLAWLCFRLLAFKYYRPSDRLNLAARSALAGCVAVIPYMAIEEFFITAIWPTALWWIYAILAAEAVSERA